MLVARDGLTLGELPAGSRVGTGSPRRAAQLRALGLGLDVVAGPRQRRHPAAAGRRRRGRRRRARPRRAGPARPPRRGHRGARPAPDAARPRPGRARGRVPRGPTPTCAPPWRRARRRRHPGRRRPPSAPCSPPSRPAAPRRSVRSPRSSRARTARELSLRAVVGSLDGAVDLRRSIVGPVDGPSGSAASWPRCCSTTAQRISTLAEPAAGQPPTQAASGRPRSPARLPSSPSVRPDRPHRSVPREPRLNHALTTEAHLVHHRQPSPAPRTRRGSPSSAPVPATPACSPCAPSSCSPPPTSSSSTRSPARTFVARLLPAPDVEVVDAGFGERRPAAHPRRAGQARGQGGQGAARGGAWSSGSWTATRPPSTAWPRRRWPAARPASPSRSCRASAPVTAVPAYAGVPLTAASTATRARRHPAATPGSTGPALDRRRRHRRAARRARGPRRARWATCSPPAATPQTPVAVTAQGTTTAAAHRRRARWARSAR